MTKIPIIRAKDSKKPKAQMIAVALMLLVAGLSFLSTVAIFNTPTEKHIVSDTNIEDNDSVWYMEYEGERYYGADIVDKRVENFTLRETRVYNGTIVETDTSQQTYYATIRYTEVSHVVILIVLMLVGMGAIAMFFVAEFKHKGPLHDFVDKGEHGDAVYLELPYKKRTVWMKVTLMDEKRIPKE